MLTVFCLTGDNSDRAQGAHGPVGGSSEASAHSTDLLALDLAYHLNQLTTSRMTKAHIAYAHSHITLETL